MKSPLLYISFFVSAWLNAAISGFIYDNDTKQPIAFASVTQGKYSAFSDMNGYFELKNFKAGSPMFIIAPGYATKNISSIPESKKIYLEPTIELEKVVIKVKKRRRRRRKRIKDTLALKLLAGIIKHKKENSPKTFKTFQYQFYNKTEYSLYDLDSTFSDTYVGKLIEPLLKNIDTTNSGSEFVPIILQEKLSNMYQHQSFGDKEIVKAEKYTGIDNRSINQLMELNFEKVNVYNNLIPIPGRGVLSPISRGSRSMYQYKILDTLREKGNTLYQVEFKPFKIEEVVFNGYFWVDSTSYAIQEILMKIDKKANINFIKEFELKYTFTQEQDLSDSTKKHWVLEKDRSRIVANLSKKWKNNNMLITAETSRKNIKINDELDKKLFRGDRTSFQTGTEKEEQEFLLNNRHDSLTLTQKKLNSHIKDLNEHKKYKRFRSSLETILSGYLLTDYPVQIGTIYQPISVNDIEGTRFRADLKTNGNFSKKIQFKTYMAYGLRDKTTKHGFRFIWKPNRVNKKYSKLTLRYRNDYRRLNALDKTYDFTINSVLRSRPIEDLIHEHMFSLDYTKDWTQNWEIKLGGQYQRFSQAHDGLEIAKIENNVRSKLDRVENVMFQSQIRWIKGVRKVELNFYRTDVLGTLPVVTFQYNQSLKFLGSDYSFSNINLSLDQDLQLPFGQLAYRLKSGMFFGDVPYMFMRVHQGNRSVYRTAAFFSMLEELEFVSDKYIEFRINHHFDGFIINKIDFLNRTKARMVLVLQGIYGSMQDQNKNLLELPLNLSSIDNHFYAETGFAIENIFKVIRFDFMWRLTQLDKNNSRNFSILFSFIPRL